MQKLEAFLSADTQAFCGNFSNINLNYSFYKKAKKNQVNKTFLY